MVQSYGKGEDLRLRCYERRPRCITWCTGRHCQHYAHPLIYPLAALFVFRQAVAFLKMADPAQKFHRIFRTSMIRHGARNSKALLNTRISGLKWSNVIMLYHCSRTLKMQQKISVWLYLGLPSAQLFDMRFRCRQAPGWECSHVLQS